jgi:hypothetical protein
VFHVWKEIQNKEEEEEADLIVHRVRRIFVLTLSGISCVTILKYTLILSPQFTKSTENKTNNQKEKSGNTISTRRVFGYLEPGRTLRTGSDK